LATTLPSQHHHAGRANERVAKLIAGLEHGADGVILRRIRRGLRRDGLVHVGIERHA
jgi:hypothetical protein